MAEAQECADRSLSAAVKEQNRLSELGHDIVRATLTEVLEFCGRDSQDLAARRPSAHSVGSDDVPTAHALLVLSLYLCALADAYEHRDGLGPREVPVDQICELHERFYGDRPEEWEALECVPTPHMSDDAFDAFHDFVQFKQSRRWRVCTAAAATLLRRDPEPFALLAMLDGASRSTSLIPVPDRDAAPEDTYSVCPY